MLVAMVLLHLSDPEASDLIERTSARFSVDEPAADNPTSRYRVDSPRRVSDAKMDMLTVEPMPCELRWLHCPSQGNISVRTPLR